MATALLSPQSSSFQKDQQDGFEVGSQVGRYRLLALIASGGMAHVWAAEPETTGGMSRTVAIKVIRPELALDPEYSRLFVDEATIATAVHHQNVCETYELDRDKNILFMAMEWVPGDSLAGFLRAGNRFWPLEFEIAARICADACAGLHAAHEAIGMDGQPLGVVHRDVSPANVLISLQGQVKVSDFGIAKARHQLHERTRTGEVKGKFAYLAPEQITGGKIDRRVDVYALGCVLYTATLGLRPFGNGPEAMRKIIVGEFKKPNEIDPTFPPGLENIILRALEHEPELRFQSAQEMGQALEAWLWEEGHIVTQADLARVANERISPEVKKAISELRSRNRAQAEVAYQMLQETFELLEPPTASTGVVVPAEVRARAESDRAKKATLAASTAPGAPSFAPSAPTARFQFDPEQPSGPTKTDVSRPLPETVRPRRVEVEDGPSREQSTIPARRWGKEENTKELLPRWLGPVGFVCLLISMAFWVWTALR